MLSALRNIWEDPVWSKVIAAGVVAAIPPVVAFLSGIRRKWLWAVITLGALVIAPATYFLVPSSRPASNLIVDKVQQVRRKPAWDNSSLDKDEVVASVRAHFDADNTEVGQIGLVAFWRLAEGFSTNWHVAKRQVGENYQLAILEGDIATAGTGDFLVGGISVKKSYKGTISVVLIAMKQDTIAASKRKWLDDENGWGFDELPHEGRIAVSAQNSFETDPVR